MHRLKNAFAGRRAAVVMGGPSLIDRRFPFERLASKDLVTFVDARALTPHLVQSGFQPDFVLMLFPEKCSHNGFHNLVFRSFLADYRIDGLVKPEYRRIVEEMRDRFDEYFEPWRPHRGPHKRYRWRSGVRLPDSPFDCLTRTPAAKLIVNRELLDSYVPQFPFPNERYYFGQSSEAEPFDRSRYYGVMDGGDVPIVRGYGFYNSAAIVLYPLLHYMGFRKAFFLGMDMSMLGTMEYAAPFTFKSMLHYRWFFRRTRHVFNAAYRPNRPWFVRPRSEFADLEAVLDPDRIDLVRVFEPYKYTVPMPFMHTVSGTEFWQN